MKFKKRFFAKPSPLSEQMPPVVTKQPDHDKPYSDFLVPNEIATRQCVYISREVHNKISKVVNVVVDKKTTIGGYIDAVLALHLEQYKDEINTLYKEQRENLI